MLVNEDSVGGWQLGVLEKLLSGGNAELITIVVKKDSGKKNTNKRKNNFLFRVWQKYVQSQSRPVTTKITSLANNASLFMCRVKPVGKFKIEVLPEDVEFLRSQKLDFFIRFGFGILTGDILQASKYGVWSYHHGDERKYRGRPSGFWEMYDGQDVIGGVLQRLTERLDGGVILKRWNVKNNKVSWSENMRSIRTSGENAVNQVCIDVVNGNASYLFSKPSESNAPNKSFPNNYQ